MFDKKVILITGASRGLGRATAQCLAQLKCNLALCARAPELKDAPWFDDLPDAKRLYRSVDLRQPEQISEFVEQVKAKFGRLDVLINNASVATPFGPIADSSLEEWMSAISTNITGSLAMAKASLPMLRESKGCYLQVISSAAFVPIAHFAPYCTTKAFQTMLTRTLGAEEPNIMCLNYDPSMMDTDMQSTIRHEAVPHMPLAYQTMFTQAYDNNMVNDLPSSGRTLAWVALHPSPNQQGSIVNGGDPHLRQKSKEWWDYIQ